MKEKKSNEVVQHLRIHDGKRHYARIVRLLHLRSDCIATRVQIHLSDDKIGVGKRKHIDDRGFP